VLVAGGSCKCRASRKARKVVTATLGRGRMHASSLPDMSIVNIIPLDSSGD